MNVSYAIKSVKAAMALLLMVAISFAASPSAMAKATSTNSAHDCQEHAQGMMAEGQHDCCDEADNGICADGLDCALACAMSVGIVAVLSDAGSGQIAIKARNHTKTNQKMVSRLTWLDAPPPRS